MAELHPHVGTLLVARTSSLFRVIIVLPYQGLLSRLSVFCSVLGPLVFDLLDNSVGGIGCGKKHNSLEILVWLFPRLLGYDVKLGGVINAKKTAVGPCLELRQILFCCVTKGRLKPCSCNR